MLIYCVFLKVRLRFTVIYKQNCSHTASTQRRTLQGPFTNNVRTPTAEDCLGNDFPRRFRFRTKETARIGTKFRADSEIGMVDRILTFWFFQFVIGFNWKCGFWCIPTPDFCVVHSWQELLFFCFCWRHFLEKTWYLVILQWLFIKWHQYGINSRNYQ